MKSTITLLIALACAGAVRADPFGTGYLAVTIEQNAVDPHSDFSLFVLKDFRWDIGNCTRLFHRNESEYQGPGAFADTSIPDSWQDWGFGIEWAARDRSSIISLSNAAGWIIGPVDEHGAFLVTCTDARLGSLAFSVATQSNAVPDGPIWPAFGVALGMLFLLKPKTTP